MDPRPILEFWFGEITETPAYRRERNRLWFSGGRAVDEEIRRRFGDLVDAAGTGALADWARAPDSCLALLILLDQFSLNIFRDEARSYALCDQALPIALAAIREGFDRRVHPVQRSFFYLPLEHAEDLSLQDEAVALFTRARDEAPSSFWRDWAQDSLDFAELHRQVVARFHRFPHRNEALGRVSTDEERDFLKSGRGF